MKITEHEQHGGALTEIRVPLSHCITLFNLRSVFHRREKRVVSLTLSSRHSSRVSPRNSPSIVAFVSPFVFAGYGNAPRAHPIA